MKKTCEIIGLPIVVISDGIEVGTVKSLVFNADKGYIDYLVIETSMQLSGTKILPTNKIIGIGIHALTIESDTDIMDINKAPEIFGMLQKDIQVKNTRILTKKGRILGITGDVIVDENNSCKIIGLEYISDTGSQRLAGIIPSKCVITLGKNLIIVSEDVESKLVKDFDSLLQTAKNFQTAQEENVNAKSHTDKLLEEESTNQELIDDEFTDPKFFDTEFINTEFADNKLISGRLIKDNFETGKSFSNNIFSDTEENAELTDQEIININLFDKELSSNDITESDELQSFHFAGSKSVSDSEDQNPIEAAANLFEQKQRDYIKGKTVTKTILSPSGDVLINEGAIITEEIINKAKLDGKLIELIMNNQHK